MICRDIPLSSVIIKGGNVRCIEVRYIEVSLYTPFDPYIIGIVKANDGKGGLSGEHRLQISQPK